MFNSIKCTTCWLRPRLPFFICNQAHLVCQECKTHLNIRKDCNSPVVTDECQDTEKEATVLNEFIQAGEKEVCQYGCGAYGAPIDLEIHEEACMQSSNPAECLIGNCKWKGYTKPLIMHVKSHHSNHLRVLSTLKSSNFLINPEMSPWLVVAHNEHSTSNQTLWVIMKQIGEQQCVAVLRHGIFGSLKSYVAFKKFNVYVTNCLNGKESAIVPYKLHLRNLLEDDKFLLEHGMALTQSAEREYRVSIVPESYPQDDNTQLVEENGNTSASGTSFQVACSFAPFGCMMKGSPEDIATHDKQCIHRTTRCALCLWQGEKKDLKNHCQGMHKLVSLDLYYSIPTEFTNFTSMSFLGLECFIMETKIALEVMFMVYHITEETTSNYFAEVRYLNTDDNFIIKHKFPCQPIAASNFDKNSLKSGQNYYSFPKILADKLKANDNTFNISFNIVTRFVVNIKNNETISN